jgi:hypothetical protein
MSFTCLLMLRFGAVLAQEAFEEIVFEVFAVNRAF